MTRAALIAPLSSFEETPQVIVFTANSEQVMWLLYAVNYEKGGRMELPQSGGALGGCADITVLPLLTGTANITFLGLGCRLKSAIDPCHLMLGVHGKTLETVHRHILNMVKPIAMSIKRVHNDVTPYSDNVRNQLTELQIRVLEAITPEKIEDSHSWTWQKHSRF